MRGFLSAALLSCALLACGSNHNGASVCDNVVPPPAACMTACDPTPGAPNTCPGGYHCTPDGHCDAQCTPSGGECGDGFHCDTEGNCQEDGACEGIQCNITKCMDMGMPATTITGKVFAPNGTLPLYGVNVYVPLHDVGPLPDGAVCNKCADGQLGDPLASDITKEDGTFTLSNIPDGTDIPVVIVSGKWRRILKIPAIAPCTSTALTAADTTLPKSMTDMTPDTVSVNMPRIAISTGGADALECLFRKMGIADSEFGTMGSDKRVHLYSDTTSSGEGASSFKTGFPGGTGPFADSMTKLWDTADHLKAYDAVILSCEGLQEPSTKPQPSLDAMKAYADFGGRVFASHWHNIWIGGDWATNGGATEMPAVWPSLAQWQDNGTYGGPDLIDEVNNPKGMAFATWMLNVMGSTVRDQVMITQGKSTVQSVDMNRVETWVTTSNNAKTPQNFQFVTPAEGDPANACGKVVFSDMHVAGNSKSPKGGTFPDSCDSGELLPQEKALAFMLFDLSSCVGALF